MPTFVGFSGHSLYFWSQSYTIANLHTRLTETMLNHTHQRRIGGSRGVCVGEQGYVPGPVDEEDANIDKE